MCVFRLNLEVLPSSIAMLIFDEADAVAPEAFNELGTLMQGKLPPTLLLEGPLGKHLTVRSKFFPFPDKSFELTTQLRFDAKEEDDYDLGLQCIGNAKPFPAHLKSFWNGYLMDKSRYRKPGTDYVTGLCLTATKAAELNLDIVSKDDGPRYLFAPSDFMPHEGATKSVHRFGATPQCPIIFTREYVIPLDLPPPKPTDEGESVEDDQDDEESDDMFHPTGDDDDTGTASHASHASKRYKADRTIPKGTMGVLNAVYWTGKDPHVFHNEDTKEFKVIVPGPKMVVMVDVPGYGTILNVNMYYI